jgi:hypothetical protein
VGRRSAAALPHWRPRYDLPTGSTTLQNLQKRRYTPTFCPARHGRPMALNGASTSMTQSKHAGFHAANEHDTAITRPAPTPTVKSKMTVRQNVVSITKKSVRWVRQRGWKFSHSAIRTATAIRMPARVGSGIRLARGAAKSASTRRTAVCNIRGWSRNLVRLLKTGVTQKVIPFERRKWRARRPVQLPSPVFLGICVLRFRTRRGQAFGSRRI